MCVCPVGYEGRQCEINKDDCDPSELTAFFAGFFFCFFGNFL